MKNKISILKLSVYSKVVDRSLITGKDNKELHQYKEQQRKKTTSDGSCGNQHKKGLLLLEIRIKGRQHKIQM